MCAFNKELDMPGEMTQEERDAMMRAIEAVKNRGITEPSVAAKPEVASATPSPSPAPDASQTMQQDPSNLDSALKRKSQQQQLDELLKAARQ